MHNALTYRMTVWLLAAVLLLAAVEARAGMAGRALVIGIDAYGADPIITPLQGAVNDAQAMRDFLEKHAGYARADIKLLLDDQATRQGILDALEDWLITGTRPGQRALLYYAGHGGQVPALDPAEVLDQVLIPVDARLTDQGVLLDFIRDKELGALLDRLADRRVVVLVDSCHSGSITRQVGGPDLDGLVRTPLGLPRAMNLSAPAHRSGARNRDAGLLPSSPDRTVWTAVSSHQLAFEDIERTPRVGFFTHRFMEGIASGRADLDGDGRVTHLELHRWLQRESRDYCGRLGPSCQFGLTPTLEVHRALQVVPVQALLAGQDVPPSQGVDTVADLALIGPAPHPATDPDLAAGRVSLSILPGTEPRLGQTVRFRIESDFNGHLLVLNIDPHGRLTQLFPNRYSQRQGKGDRIEPGRPVTIPDPTYGFEFPVQEPLGPGRVLALVTAEPVDFSDLADPARSIVPVPIGQEVDYLLLIAERLRTTRPHGDPHHPLRWALGEQQYRTRP